MREYIDTPNARIEYTRYTHYIINENGTPIAAFDNLNDTINYLEKNGYTKGVNDRWTRIPNKILNLCETVTIIQL